VRSDQILETPFEVDGFQDRHLLDCLLHQEHVLICLSRQSIKGQLTDVPVECQKVGKCLEIVEWRLQDLDAHRLDIWRQNEVEWRVSFFVPGEACLADADRGEKARDQHAFLKQICVVTIVGDQVI